MATSARVSGTGETGPVVRYDEMRTGILELVESARCESARGVNALMTASYWDTGRRIVEFEQHGANRAEYGTALIERLGADLSHRLGRGFAPRSLAKMRAFYLAWRSLDILPTPSAESYSGGNRERPLVELASRFPLPWSAYVRLLSVNDAAARRFYESETLRCGWSVRQLDRQIGTQFYERSEMISRSSGVNVVCGWTTAGFESTSCFFIGA